MEIRMRKQMVILLLLAVIGAAAAELLMTMVEGSVFSSSAEAEWTQEDPLQPSIASKVLRFHILANSDSSEDQKLKEEVRDTVGGYVESLLSEASSLEDSKRIVLDHLDEINEVARGRIAENGYSYPVSSALETVDFPVKTYGEYTFPAGKYEALEVTIGEGAGHNWWCVLYPQMCFRGSVYEVVTEDAKQDLKEVLSPEEYEDVWNGGEIKMRFRFWDTIKKWFGVES